MTTLGRDAWAGPAAGTARGMTQPDGTTPSAPDVDQPDGGSHASPDEETGRTPSAPDVDQPDDGPQDG